MRKRNLNNKKKIIYIAISLIAFILIWFGFFIDSDDRKPNSEIKISENKPTWNTYINKDYGFSIDFPTNWKVYENYTDTDPTINIYLPKKNINPPFDNFSEISQVSIFPKGLGTGIVIGQSQKTDVDFNFKSDESVDYILEDKTPWATFISFDNVVEPWKKWGFLWSRLIIDNVEYKCLNNGQQVSLTTCNPFADDEFIRSGQVDQQIREIQKEIIASFKFIPSK